MLISAVGVSSLRYNIIGANKQFTWMVLLFLLTESFSQVRPCGDQDWTLLGCIYYPLFIRVKSLIEMCTSFPRESWLKPRLCWVHIWTPLGSGPDYVGFRSRLCWVQACFLTALETRPDIPVVTVGCRSD